MGYKTYRIFCRSNPVGTMSYQLTFPQRLVAAGLIVHKKDATMKSQIVEELAVLSKQDLCVCGSGKKHADCCPEIKHGSVLAELLAKYRYLDEKISTEQERQGVSFVCTKGCSACCSHYFYISMMEYFLIRTELVKQHRFLEAQQKAEKAMHALSVCAPQEIAKWSETSTSIDRMMNDHSAVDRCPPCAALDDKNGCSVYRVRPLVCRLYGVSNLYEACQKIYNRCRPLPFMKATQHKLSKSLINLEIDAFTLHENVDWFAQGSTPHFIKPYPLIYWLTTDADYFAAYTLASTKPIAEFKDELKHWR